MKVDICNTDKKYNLITADPPWQYGSGGPRGGKFGQLDYQTMKTKDICALPVADLADDNCALLMWFTASFVEDAIQVRNQYMVQKAEYTGKHSEKPEEILELFDTRFGDVPRIELFAREHRDGWDCWGNEVD